MVGANVNIKLFEFQEKAVLSLIDLSTSSNKQTITVKSPTGSGKTIILINYIDEYLNKIDNNTAFVWLCPGKGDLEEQSRKKMIKYAPTRKAQPLTDALNYGFKPETTTFINWELVTKTGNLAISDDERQNLFERIAEAKRNGINFIVVIDEEHSNNTSKANSIIDSFVAKHIIRMSATAQKNNRFEYYEIDEIDVINAGLITKALYVNEGVQEGTLIGKDYDDLIELADKKRKEISSRYQSIGKNIRPLVLIQFPNGSPESILAVEEKLQALGYSYDNGLVSKWMSEDKKDLPDNLTENNSTPVFLLMKQAISTGWDCPRAKILVKLREGMNEQFEIQTIGRIRRMPERIHYDDDLLDYCYVYTYDEEWKNGLLANMDKAYETRRLFLKSKCKTFTLQKELRNLDFGMIGEREVLKKIYDHYVDKYSLGNDKKMNRLILQNNGYILGDALQSQILQGIYVKTEAVSSDDATYITTKREVDTHKHGIYLLHSTDEIKKAIGLQTSQVKAILERLFRKNLLQTKKILSLDTKEFYAFIINNAKLIKKEFVEVTATMYKQTSLVLSPKMMEFHIPEQDFYKFDPKVKNEIDILSNAYTGYTSAFNTSLVRSRSERLFERYCENTNDIDWVYKNGDSGQQYFSIVYIDGLRKQWLFYPDYIVKKTDGTIWIIETKGGQKADGTSNNIDIQIQNKFVAFKEYAEKQKLNWGFVRDYDDDLYINNTEFSLDMNDEHWIQLSKKF